MSLEYRACNHIARLQPRTVNRWKLYTAVLVTALSAAFISYNVTVSYQYFNNRLRYMESEMSFIGNEMIRLNQILFAVPKDQQPNSKDIERSLRRTNEIVENAVRSQTAELRKELRQELATTQHDMQQLRGNIISLRTTFSHGHTTVHRNDHLSYENMIDYALESMGATIDSIGTTQMVSIEKPPRMLMQRSRSAGECFAFYGQTGEVVIRLQRPVNVEAVSMDHIPASMTPDGTRDTAPREFSVYGLNRRQNGLSHFFGTYHYEQQQQRWQVFTFPKDRLSNRSFELVHFKFLSNHGNARLTCVYQTGIHGLAAV